MLVKTKRKGVMWLQKIKYFLVTVLVSTTMIPIQGASAASCNDLEIIFVRGSGSAFRGEDYVEFENSMNNALSGTSLKYAFYELGESTHGGAQYPAAGIGVDSWDSFATTVGAYVSAGEAYAFGESVNQGVQELTSYIKESCASTKFILAGYSQGGMVISKALPSINSDRIIYAATFGDPKLYLPEGFGRNPDACQGKNLSDYRAYVPDCKTAEGILGGYNPYRPHEFIGKLGAWCANKDIMCGSSWELLDLFAGHVSYAPDHIYQAAAYTIAGKIAAYFPTGNIKISKDTNVSTHDTAILIDSTGSMGGLIDTYKEEAKRLAKRTLESGGRIALYEYRDLSDPFETIQHCDFTCDYDTFVSKLNEIRADGGGDTPESALSGLMHVMNTLKWQQGATKSIVLLTDAGYHLTDYDGTTLADVTKRSLEIDPVNIYTVTPSSVMSGYAELVKSTNGASFNSAENLEISTTTIMERPAAILPLAEYSGAPGDTFTFDASFSTASSKIDHYEWDLDFDGVFETSTITPIITKTYSSVGSGFIQVKVVDANGLSSTMSAQVEIKYPETPATITKMYHQKLSDTSAEINFETSENTALVALVVEDNFYGLVEGNSFVIDGLEKETRITLIPVAASGQRGNSSSITVGAKITAPDTGAI